MSEGRHVNHDEEVFLESVAEHAKRFMSARVELNEVDRAVSDEWKFQMLANHPDHPHYYLKTHLGKEDLWYRGMDQLLMPAYDYVETHKEEPGWRANFFTKAEEMYDRKLSNYEVNAINQYFDYIDVPSTQPIDQIAN